MAGIELRASTAARPKLTRSRIGSLAKLAKRARMVRIGHCSLRVAPLVLYVTAIMHCAPHVQVGGKAMLSSAFCDKGKPS